MWAAGISEQGNVRGNNEDRYHIDAERGIYLVVDGMGGQAAGEEAAEIAVTTLRARLERQTDSADLRIREAIALANNAIYEAAGANASWAGMACVLTVAVLEDGTATVGHVGDSRAYRISGGNIEKITRDHSPVGEQEDAGRLTEDAAMRHPRRNEVYRDVGSQPRTPDDADFVEIYHLPFGKRDALLLCSDGLSDVVPSRRLAQVVEAHPGDPQAALQNLVAEAVATGRDNVSAILVEGDEFAKAAPPAAAMPAAAIPAAALADSPGSRQHRGPLWLVLASVLVALLAGFGSGYLAATMLKPTAPVHRVLQVGTAGGFATVPEAVLQAESGDIVNVDAGEYPERVVLKEGTRLQGTDRAHLNGGITADGVQYASVTGITAAAIEIHNSRVDLENICVPGAAVAFTGASSGSLRHSRIGKLQVDAGLNPTLEGNTIESGR